MLGDIAAIGGLTLFLGFLWLARETVFEFLGFLIAIALWVGVVTFVVWSIDRVGSWLL